MHIDDEQVQRLLHGELGPRTEAAVREHVAGCGGCRDRVALAAGDEEQVQALFRLVDHAPPLVTVEMIAARARGRGAGWGRWAAGVVLALGVAGAAYALPGSPLRAWVEAVATWFGAGADTSPRAPTSDPAPEASVAGLAVVPGRELVIVFTSPQTEGQVRVSLTDGAEVMVRAVNGAPTFTSYADRLVIDNQGSTARFEIQIPRAAPRVEIEVTGARVFLKDGPRVSTPFPADSAGFHLLPLRAPDP